MSCFARIGFLESVLAGEEIKKLPALMQGSAAYCLKCLVFFPGGKVGICLLISYDDK